MHVDDQYIAKPPLVQLCGTRNNTMENCYSCSILHPWCIVCCQVALVHSGLEAASQLTSQLQLPEQCHTLDEWRGSLCACKNSSNMKQFSLTVCVCRQREHSVSTDSQQWTTVFIAQCTIFSNDKSATSLSLSCSISMARVNMANI